MPRHLLSRKIRRDSAVSPVIAVILMVAITVVLAATVYVWVSGFGAQSSQPAKTVALTSNGAIDSNGDKPYTIASATAGMRWSDVSVTVNGAAYTLDTTTACTAALTGATYSACSGGSTETGAGTVNAGDQLKIGNVAAGQTLRVLDTQANSVIVTLTIG